jgi:hypothetical protein
MKAAFSRASRPWQAIAAPHPARGPRTGESESSAGDVFLRENMSRFAAKAGAIATGSAAIIVNSLINNIIAQR